MAKPNTRETFKQYCLRKLGKPVIEINVDDDQVEDRIDEGLQYFQEYHFDGVERTYMRHQLTGSTVAVTSVSGTFSNGEIITGGTSGATATVSSANSTVITFSLAKDTDGISNNNVSSSFSDSETITGNNSGATATAGIVTMGDIDNHYITVSDNILGIINIFDINQGGSTSSDLFSFKYQFHFNEMPYLTAGSVINYQQSMQHIQLINDIFVGKKPIRYQKHTNRLYLDLDWENNDVEIDDYIVAEVYSILDPASYADVYNDLFLKKYVTALIKRQWGANLIKYDGVQLPGGTTLNGRQLFDDAQQEIREVEEEMNSRHELPVDFIVAPGPF